MGRIGTQRRSRETLRPAAKRPVRPRGSARAGGRHGWRLLAIWGLVFIAYSNSFQAGLVFDNSSVIGQDPRIRQATPQNIASILTGGYRYAGATAGLYRPLTTFSILLNYAVFGNGRGPRDIIGSISWCMQSMLRWCMRSASWFSEKLRQLGHWPRSGDCIRCSPNPLPILWGGPTCWPPSGFWRVCCAT